MRDEALTMRLLKLEKGGRVMRLADSILIELDQEAQTTKKVLDRVPNDKLAWKPHAKSYSLGQLALHVASAPGDVAAIAAQDTVEASNFSQPEAKGRQQVLETFARSLESAKGIVSKMDDESLSPSWTLTRNGKVILSMPRAA